MTNYKFSCAFDIDNTLIDRFDRPIHDNLFLLLQFVRLGADVVVWSGGGTDYAERRVRQLGIDNVVRIIPKGSERVDLAIDDQPVDLGFANFQVPYLDS